jgi:hypothetical protein
MQVHCPLTFAYKKATHILYGCSYFIKGCFIPTLCCFMERENNGQFSSRYGVSHEVGENVTKIVAEMYVSASYAAEILCAEVKIVYKNYAPAGAMLCWFLEEYCGVSVYLLIEEMLPQHKFLSAFISIFAEHLPVC